MRKLVLLAVLAGCRLTPAGGADAGADAPVDGAPPADAADDASADANTGLILSTQGITVISDPATVGAGMLESDDTAFVFIERVDGLAGSPVSVSFRGAGTYNDNFGQIDPVPIPAGSTVTSIYVHVDKIGSSAPLVTINGQIEFSRPVIALITSGALLSASTPSLGNGVTDYSGLGDLDSGEDSVTILPGETTVTFSLATNTFSDAMRILLASP